MSKSKLTSKVNIVPSGEKIRNSGSHHQFDIICVDENDKNNGNVVGWCKMNKCGKYLALGFLWMRKNEEDDGTYKELADMNKEELAEFSGYDYNEDSYEMPVNEKEKFMKYGFEAVKWIVANVKAFAVCSDCFKFNKWFWDYCLEEIGGVWKDWTSYNNGIGCVILQDREVKSEEKIESAVEKSGQEGIEKVLHYGNGL